MHSNLLFAGFIPLVAAKACSSVIAKTHFVTSVVTTIEYSTIPSGPSCTASNAIPSESSFSRLSIPPSDTTLEWTPPPPPTGTDFVWLPSPEPTVSDAEAAASSSVYEHSPSPSGDEDFVSTSPAATAETSRTEQKSSATNVSEHSNSIPTAHPSAVSSGSSASATAPVTSESSVTASDEEPCTTTALESSPTSGDFASTTSTIEQSETTSASSQLVPTSTAVSESTPKPTFTTEETSESTATSIGMSSKTTTSAVETSQTSASSTGVSTQAITSATETCETTTTSPEETPESTITSTHVSFEATTPAPGTHETTATSPEVSSEATSTCTTTITTATSAEESVEVETSSAEETFGPSTSCTTTTTTATSAETSPEASTTCTTTSAETSSETSTSTCTTTTAAASAETSSEASTTTCTTTSAETSPEASTTCTTTSAETSSETSTSTCTTTTTAATSAETSSEASTSPEVSSTTSTAETSVPLVTTTIIPTTLSSKITTTTSISTEAPSASEPSTTSAAATSTTEAPEQTKLPRAYPADIVDELQDESMENLERWLSENNSNGCTLATASVRREWGDLSLEQREDYVGAVLCLQSAPSLYAGQVPGAKSRFDDFVATHQAQTNHIHGTANFLTWHRYFIHEFEQALKNECGYQGVMPYWNWDRYADDPENSPLFNGDSGSFSGNSGPSGCVETGPFKDYTVNLGPGSSTRYNPRCLQRDISKNAARYTKVDITYPLITQSDTVGLFQDRLQGSNNVHASGHFTIGGNPGGDIFTSPGDPYFHLHHAGVDRLYWIWQLQDLNSRLSQVAGRNGQTGRAGSLTETMNLGLNAGDVELGSLLNTMGGLNGELCYIYY